jgi:IS5 family transposase
MSIKTKTNLAFPGIDLADQTSIRLPLPLVLGNKDYREHQALLVRMSEILTSSGMEEAFVIDAIAQESDACAAQGKVSTPFTDRRRQSVRQHAIRTLRCTVGRILSNECHRKFSCHLAESQLLRWFCGYSEIGEIRVPSKSTLQRMESDVSAEVMRSLNDLLLRSATEVLPDGESSIGLEERVDLSMIWMDSTCAELNIHYPVDWTLLRDGTRSIIRCIKVIRSHGLRCRMPDPSTFVANMNQRAMAMSGASRKGRGGDKARTRKRELRAMKRLAKKVIEHGRRYLKNLMSNWRTTDLSEPQALQIGTRLERILDTMPAAIEQAHERIIGERPVPNDKKLLSLYEQHAEVYIRGKSGADAEFGLQLLLSESAEGLIVDCHLVPDGIESDSNLLVPALKRIRQGLGPCAALAAVTDRGFNSRKNSGEMKEMNIQDVTLPRSPIELKDKLQDPKVRALQKRRAQTEARIGIFKANFLGDCIPTKGFIAQERYVAWATLTHNLWVLARLNQSKIRSARSA